jgi:glycosyltransferase involved in cell wall biosynthesis
MVILKDVTLCGITGDELKNHAGGIRSYVDAHVPFVERAIIHDTGSTDGTRDVLRSFESLYSHLQVRYRPFENYGSARNGVLSEVTTKWALVLDMDERISPIDFETLDLVLKERSERLAFDFGFLDVFPDGSEHVGGNHNPRLFRADLGLRYFRPIFELLVPGSELKGWTVIHANSGVTIKHYRAPYQEFRAKKRRNLELAQSLF